MSISREPASCFVRPSPWPVRPMGLPQANWRRPFNPCRGQPTILYDARRAAYDLKKLRGKDLVSKLDNSRRYSVPPQAIRTIAALVILRDKVLRPILAGVGKPRMGRKPKTWSPIDEHYEAIRQNMFTLMDDLRITA